VRLDARTPMASCKLLGVDEHAPSVSESLHVVSHGYAPKRRDLAVNIDANHANWLLLAPENEWESSGPGFVGMIRVIGASSTAPLEQDVATNVVVRAPLALVGGTPQLRQRSSQTPLRGPAHRGQSSARS
jgi:hypothetical protein